MSNKALNYVWEHSKQQGSARVLMLAIADMSNDEGECYPGNSKLTEKVLCTERNLQKLVDKCETDGELMVIEHGGIKTKNGWTNRYIIVGMSKKTPQEVNARTPRKKSRDVKGDTPRDVKPDVSRDVKGDTQNPKGNPQTEPSEKEKDSADADAETKSPKQNIWYDTVFEAFGISASWNGGMQKMLQGIATDNTHKKYNLVEPITPEELINWRDWYRESNGYPSPSFMMVKSPVKVQSSITTWQALGKPSPKPIKEREEYQRYEAPVVLSPEETAANKSLLHQVAQAMRLR